MLREVKKAGKSTGVPGLKICRDDFLPAGGIGEEPGGKQIFYTSIPNRAHSRKCVHRRPGSASADGNGSGPREPPSQVCRAFPLDAPCSRAKFFWADLSTGCPASLFEGIHSRRKCADR